MTWSLNAAGHAAASTAEDYMEHARVLESELVAELKAVLDNPKWGTTSSSFSGNTYSGAIHTSATVTGTDSTSTGGTSAPSA